MFLRRLIVGSAVLGFPWTLSAGGAPESSIDWRITELKPGFSLAGHVHEAMDVSAVARGDGPFGIIASDEGAVVQVLRFSPDRRRAAIVHDVALSQPSDREVDFEASAYADGWFYVTGSHGAAKKKGAYTPDRARVYRFRLNEETGSLESLQSASLADVFDRDEVLARYHRRPLQQAGVNIEGLAAREGHLYFGLRSPNVQGDALVVRIRADELFNSLEPPAHQLLRVPVGRGLGIRGMTSVRAGFLLVLGNAGSEPSKRFPIAVDYKEGRAAEMYHWNPDNRSAQFLGHLPDGSDAHEDNGKAEAVLALHSSETEAIEFLVAFDSVEGGGFRKFRVERR